jgi:hypothetical protein
MFLLKNFMGERKNKQLKNAKILLAVFGFILVLFGGVETAQAAYFYFNPADDVFHKNENFTVDVLVSAEKAINAAQGTINFPSEYLEVIGTKSDINSIVDLWVQKPSFSNVGDVGNVRFGGVILNPGFSGTNGKIMGIIFRVKKEGAADLVFGESAILANDGLGTNISGPNKKANFVFIQAVSTEEQKTFQEEDLEALQEKLQEKIESFEQKIGSQTSTKIVLVESEKGILNFWKILPQWVKISILALVGVAAITVSLILVGLGLIILIWLSKYILHLPFKIKNLFTRVAGVTETVKEEFEGDVKYTKQELKKDFKKIENGESLKGTFKNYLISLKKIIKRLFTKNRF